MALNKNDVQKELAKLQKELDELTKRRAVISDDLKRSTEKINAQRDALAANTLAGLDTSQGFVTLEREERQANAWQTAITLADGQCKNLQIQIEDKQRILKNLEFYQMNDETNSAVLDFISKAREMVTAFPRVQELYANQERVYPIEYATEESQAIYRAFKYLISDFDIASGMPHKLKELEQNYAAIMARVNRLNS